MNNIKHINMSLFLSIIGIILVLGFLFLKSKPTETTPEIVDRKTTSKPFLIEKPTTNKINDKIIVIKNLKVDYLKQAIKQFCDLSNQISYVALPRLTVLENQSIITFPYDIEFDQFCYFINYIKYAHELADKSDYKPQIRAWYTTKADDQWITEEMANKAIMLYIPDSDEEYDNVYLTTSDHLCFKVSFTKRGKNQKLKKPALAFEERPSDLNLEDKETFDFE